LTQLNGVKTSAAAAGSDSDNDSEYDSDTAAMDIDVDAATAASSTAKKGKKKSKKAKSDTNTDDNGDGGVGGDDDSECGVIMQSKVNALIEKLQAIRGNYNCNTLEWKCFTVIYCVRRDYASRAFTETHERFILSSQACYAQ
jgi:hypothetical protein